jgi:two-component system alkaline phosphatase synthesis response regulator PhoP
MTTVLLINREESTVAWLKSGLETAGFRVITAQDGPTGLDLARSESPALILLDLMLPALAEGSNGDTGGAEMDGCKFLRRLRRESKAGVIVLSRRDDEAIKLAALQSGADDYLTRSCSRLELLARMRAVLRRVERHFKDSGAGSVEQTSVERTE